MGKHVNAPLDPPGYAKRVREFEEAGMNTSDAQGAADAEYLHPVEPWTDSEGDERTHPRDPTNDEHYDGNDEQIDDLKELVEELRAKLEKGTP